MLFTDRFTRPARLRFEHVTPGLPCPRAIHDPTQGKWMAIPVKSSSVVAYAKELAIINGPVD